jgi:hypothetical protein
MRSTLDLIFENLPAIDKEINRQIDNGEYDDSIPWITFAHSDSLYFGYKDDFNWNREGDIKNYFPSRSVFIYKKDTALKRKWISELDLYGIPCD